MPILLEEFATGLWAGDPQYALPGSGTSAPPGLEALFEYNGITIHDRKVIDKYRVTGIEGLHGGPSVRVTSQKNQGAHGSTPGNNFMDERAFIIEGVIEAGNIGKLRDMEQALRTAFFSMTEKPLVLRTGDVKRDVYINSRITDKIGLKEVQDRVDCVQRDFQISMVASNPRILSINSRTYSIALGVSDDFSGGVTAWTIDSGSAYSIVSGQLSLPTASTRSTRNDLGYKPIDSRETIKVVAPATIANGDQIGVRIKRVDDSNYVWARLRATSATAGVLEVVKTVGGSDTTLVTTSSLTIAGGSTYWIQASIVANAITVKLFSTDPTPGPGTQVGSTGSYALTAGAEQTAFGSIVGGDTGLRSVSTNSWKVDDFEVEPLSLNHQVLTPRHAGNFLALPVVRVYGPMTDVVIQNVAYMPDDNYQRSIKINGSIPANDYYEYDARTGRLVNSTGVNKYAQFDVVSKQLQLVNGDNPISIQAASSSGTTPQLMVTFQDTWV